jgi:DNA-binding NarL/FixJ family response regulator
MTGLVDRLFVGRLTELARLRASLDEARAGRPQLVVLEGPGGIGKTTLLERFVAGENDLTVLRASGEQWEKALLPYGLLDQLVRVASTEGAPSSSAAEDPITVGTRLLQLWGDLQDERVVVTVIDDAHWADSDSLHALLFAFRRLVTDRVLVVMTTRDLQAPSMPEGLRRIALGPSGGVLQVGPLNAGEVSELANRMVGGLLPAGAAEQLYQHTEGNPLYLRMVVEETSRNAWREWDPELPAPRAFTTGVVRRLESCDATVRDFVEAGSVLGRQFDLDTAATISDTEDPLRAVDAATEAGILESSRGTHLQVKFSHPMVRTAVYDQLSLARRAVLHAKAARLVDDEAESLRHRVSATHGVEPALIADLEDYATREAARGAWASTASTLAIISRLSPTKSARQQLLVRAVNAMIAGGDLIRAKPYAQQIMSMRPSPRSDATLGHLAILSGDPAEAERRLGSAWRGVDRTEDPELPAGIAQRNALNAMGRLEALEMVEWAQQSISLAVPGQPESADAAAMLGIGLGFLGRADEGLATQRTRLSAATSMTGPGSDGLALRMAHGWLHLATDDIPGALSELSAAAPAALQAGSYRVALYSFTWLARSHFSSGDWDEAIVDADRALTLLSETEHEWLRPLVRWAATAVPAARGEWETAEHHAQAAAAGPGSYELMVTCAGMASAQVADARGDHESVLRALEPVLGLLPREAIEEPGFWPWHHLYADALINTGRLEEAESFLRVREDLAARRHHRSTIARLSRSRGRLEAAAGRTPAALAAFQLGAHHLEHLSLPFDQAKHDLAWGQVLRRDGQRRLAAERLRRAAEVFTTLQARPFLDRTERELTACGLLPASRKGYDLNRLTPHEVAVANLVGRGMTNRQIAAEIMISVKTVQAHLTKIYAKVGVASRAELMVKIHQNHPQSVGGTSGTP